MTWPSQKHIRAVVGRGSRIRMERQAMCGRAVSCTIGGSQEKLIFSGITELMCLKVDETICELKFVTGYAGVLTEYSIIIHMFYGSVSN